MVRNDRNNKDFLAREPNVTFLTYRIINQNGRRNEAGPRNKVHKFPVLPGQASFRQKFLEVPKVVYPLVPLEQKREA